MPSLVHQRGQALVTSPDDIRDDIVRFGEEDTWCNACSSQPTILRPTSQFLIDVPTGLLMVPMGLFGHKQLSIDNLVARAIIRQEIYVCGCPTRPLNCRCAHSGLLPLLAQIGTPIIPYLFAPQW